MARLEEIVVHVDLVNEECFLDIIQRAIDLLEATDRVIAQSESGRALELGPLKEAATEFRSWFENGE